MLDSYLSVGLNTETGLYHGLVYKNHPTPSGFNRYFLSLSTNQGFESELLAAEFINLQFPEIDPIDTSKLNSFSVKDLNIPPGSEITVMSYNHKSKDPAPKDEFPQIRVFHKNKKINVDLNKEKIDYLIKIKKIRFDSSSGFDPELSCLYEHYYVS